MRWLGIVLGTLRSAVRTHRELALENLALRQQLAVSKARQPRPRLTEIDRIFWVLLSRLWTGWRHSLLVVRPQTVIGWHRHGFRRRWAWRSRRRSGRPAIDGELRDLIRRMSHANPLWGAPRIHGELRKLGLAVSQATVSKCMLRPPRPPSQAVLEQPRLGPHRIGFLYGADGNVSSPLRADHGDARAAPAGALQCHGAPDRRMDGATAARGVPAGGEPSVSDPGCLAQGSDYDKRSSFFALWRCESAVIRPPSRRGKNHRLQTGPTEKSAVGKQGDEIRLCDNADQAVVVNHKDRTDLAFCHETHGSRE
jgi:hypothetical protein